MTIKRRVSLLLLLSLELLGFLTVSGDTIYEYEIEFDFEGQPEEVLSNEGLCSLNSTTITGIEQVMTASSIILNYPNVTFDSNHAMIDVIYPDCCSDSTCDDDGTDDGVRRLQRSRFIKRLRFRTPPASCYIGCPPLIFPPPPPTLRILRSLTNNIRDDQNPTCQDDIPSVLKRAKVTNEKILNKLNNQKFTNSDRVEVVEILTETIGSPLQYANVVFDYQHKLETYMDASRDIVATERFTDDVYLQTTYATVIAPTFFQIQSLFSGNDSPAFENRLCVQPTTKKGNKVLTCNNSPKQKWRADFQGQLQNKKDDQCLKLDDNSDCTLFDIKGLFIKIKNMEDDQYLTTSDSEAVSKELALPRTFDQQWKLIYDEMEDWKKIYQPIYGHSPGVKFGKSLAFSDDGSLLVVGSGTKNACRIQLFEMKDYRWEEVYRANTKEYLDFGDFGTSVGVTRNNEVVVLVIGSPEDNGEGFVIIKRWEQFTADKNDYSTQKLQGKKTEKFGSAVALSSTGTYLVVAAEGLEDESGRVISFSWVDDKLFVEQNNASTKSSGPICVAVSNADDRYVFGTFGSSSKVQVRKGDRKEKFKKIPDGSVLKCPVAFSGDGSIILVGAGNEIQTYEQKPNKKKTKTTWKRMNNKIPFVKLNEDEIKVAMSKDGSIVAIAISGESNNPNQYLSRVSIFKEETKLGQDILLGGIGSHKAKVNLVIALSENGKTLIVGDSLHNGNLNFERETGKVDIYNLQFGKNFMLA